MQGPPRQLALSRVFVDLAPVADNEARWEFGHAQSPRRAVEVLRNPGMNACDVSRDRLISLYEKSLSRMLEGGDRTVGIGKGGLEMGEDVGRGWPMRSRQVGRLAPLK